MHKILAIWFCNPGSLQRLFFIVPFQKIYSSSWITCMLYPVGFRFHLLFFFCIFSKLNKFMELMPYIDITKDGQRNISWIFISFLSTYVSSSLLFSFFLSIFYLFLSFFTFLLSFSFFYFPCYIYNELHIIETYENHKFWLQ